MKAHFFLAVQKRLFPWQFIWPVIPHEFDDKDENSYRIISLVASLMIGALSLLLASYFMLDKASRKESISFSLLLNIVKNINFTNVLIGFSLWVISFAVTQIWLMKDILKRHLLVSNAYNVYSQINREREKYFRAILFNSNDPCAILQKCLKIETNDQFDINKIAQEVKSLDEGDTIYAIDMFDTINKEKLGTDEVKRYLTTMADMVESREVWVKRRFRKRGKTYSDIVSDEKGRCKLLELLEVMDLHDKMKFNPEIELFENSHEVNPFLDYVIMTKGGKRKAFITSVEDVEKEGKYKGIVVTDQLILDILMEDRFRSAVFKDQYANFATILRQLNVSQSPS